MIGWEECLWNDQFYHTQWTAYGCVFAAVCDFFVCVWNISGTAQRICDKFTGKTCLVPRSDEFECQGQRSRLSGPKNGIFRPFQQPMCSLFGKTSLACSSCTVMYFLSVLMSWRSTFLIIVIVWQKTSHRIKKNIKYVKNWTKDSQCYIWGNHVQNMSHFIDDCVDLFLE